MDGDRQRWRSPSRHRRFLLDAVDLRNVEESLAGDRFRPNRDPRRARGLLGRRGAKVHSFESSLDGRVWTHLCATRHGEGGLEVFAFPPREARFVRWTFENPEPEHSLEVVEINLYGPDQAASVREPGRIPALGHAPVKIPPGDSITVDFGYIRSPLGVLVQWGDLRHRFFGSPLRRWRELSGGRPHHPGQRRLR